jgi:hypothetical protein
MVRRTDRLLLQVRVSFEATRFGPQHLIEAPRPKRSNAQPPKTKVATVTARGGDR